MNRAATTVKTDSSSSLDTVDYNETKPNTIEHKDSSSSMNNMSSLTSTESMSDDNANNGEWIENENGEMKQQVPYRMFFDSREKKLQEKIEFVKVVCKYKTQLFGDCDGHEVTPRSKEDAWKKVAAEVEDLGLESYRGKPWSRLRDHDWQYVRRHALTRSENTSRPIGKLGELDKIVLEVISTTALTNAVSQATNSSIFISQGSTNSQTSQQSTDSVEQYIRTFLGSVNHDSCSETPEIGFGSFEMKDDFPKISLSNSKIEDPIAINTSANVANCSNAENILDILSKVTQNVAVPTSCLSVDAALSASKAALNKSPISRKITSRSATAPSVYSITSSTSPQNLISNSCSSSSPSGSCANIAPPSKKARIELEKSPTNLTITPSFEQERETLIIRKLEVEIRHTELLNEKLEREIRAIEGQERRAAELHALEMRAAKARLLRGSAIDESSIDKPKDISNRILVRQANEYII